MFPEGEEDEKDYVSFYISNKSKNSIFYENDDFNAKFVLFIRNFKNYSSFKAERNYKIYCLLLTYNIKIFFYLNIF